MAELTAEVIAERIAKSIAAMPVLIAETVGDAIGLKPKRKRRRKMPRKKSGPGRAFGRRAKCIQRRKGARGKRRCNSLFYADCLKKNGTTKKTAYCKKRMRTKLSH